MKAQTPVVGIVIITGIMIALVSAILVWGRPLIDKVLDRTHFGAVMDKMEEIDKAIKYVAQTESSQKIELYIKDNEYMQINSDGEILFKSTTRIPVIGSKTWVPLNDYELPKQREIITSNTTATYCSSCDFGITGVEENDVVKYGNITIEGSWYELPVFKLSGTTTYGKVCMNNTEVSDGDCGVVNDYITKEGIMHKVLFINKSGTEVILQGAEKDVIGLLGKDEPGILVGKSLASENFFEINMKLVYRSLIDSTGREYKYIISCPSNCMIRKGSRVLKISFDKISKKVDRTDIYIKTSLE